MNLKILIGILLYYSLISMFFFFGGTQLGDSGYTTTANISTIDTSEETSPGGIFSALGVSFTRWWVFMNFGIAIGWDVPIWFSILFMIWQTGFSIFVAAFIISSIWNG